MKFCVIHPVTGEVLSRHYLQRGQSIDLRGQTAFVVKGKYGNSDDGCADSYVPGAGGGPINAKATLRSGQNINVDKAFKSPNGKYVLYYQSDNNLVLYTEDRPVWSSNTAGTPNASRVSMQGDGNLVIYTRDGTPVWASNTDGNPGAYLALDNNGLLAMLNSKGGVIKVFYEGVPAGLKRDEMLKPGKSVSSTNQEYELAFQGDSNLVLYHLVDGSGTPVWSSGTVGQPNPGNLVMQGDGNLVMYDQSGKPIWHSETDGHNDASLALYSNGRLAIVDVNGNVIKELFKGN